MFKKVLTMALAVAMLISCFGAVASADYGYSYGEQIAKKTGAGNVTGDQNIANAGDSVTQKYNKLIGLTTVGTTDGTRAFYYLYNYDSSTGYYTRDDAEAEGVARKAPYISFDSYYTRLPIVDFKERTYTFNSTAHAGKYFFTGGTKAGIPTLTIKQKSGVTPEVATTKTYEYNLKFAEGADYPKMVMKLYASSGKAYNVLGVQENGYLCSGSLAWNTAKIDKLEKGREYTISLVMDVTPNAEDATKYDVYKKIYVRDNSQENPEFALRFYTLVERKVDVAPSYLQCDWEFYPFTSEAVTDTTLWDNLISENNTNYYASGQGSTTPTYEPTQDAIKFKYQLKNVNFYIDDFTIYAGDTHSIATQADGVKLYASSSVNTINLPDVQKFVVAAEASADTAVTGGKIVLASFTPNGVLQNVVTEDLKVTAGKIEETRIEIAKVQAVDAVYKLMYLNDLGNLVPLSEAATFVQPEIWKDPALAE